MFNVYAKMLVIFRNIKNMTLEEKKNQVVVHEIRKKKAILQSLKRYYEVLLFYYKFDTSWYLDTMRYQILH